MVDCLPSAIIHAYMGESVIPYIMRKSVAKYRGLLPVEFHSNQYLYYASDFFSSTNTYDIVSCLNKHSDVYYLLITDFLIRNTSQELLFCALFLSSYHKSIDEKTDNFETSFYSVEIELILSKVKMHVRQEPYSYIANTYNVEQAPLVVLKNQIISISPEIQNIKKSIWFCMLINQQLILGISILTNHILLHELQRRLIILSAWRRINNGVCINLFTDNTSIFSTDIGKENYIVLIIFAFTLQKLLDISLYNLVFTFKNEAIF